MSVVQDVQESECRKRRAAYALCRQDRCRPVRILTLVSLLLTMGVAQGQPTGTSSNGMLASESSEPVVSVEAIDALLDTLANSPQIEEPARTQIQDLGRQAKEDLAQVTALNEAMVTQQQRVDAIEATVASLQQQLAEVRNGELPVPGSREPIAVLKAELVDWQRQLALARTDLNALDQEDQARLVRRQSLRSQMISQPQELARVLRDLESPPLADQPALLTEMVRLSLLARRALLQLQPAAISSEFNMYDAEEAARIPRLRRDLILARLERLERISRIWSDEISKLERIDVQSRIAEVEQLLQGRLPAEVAGVYQRNLLIVREEAEQRSQRDQIQRQTEQLRESETSLRVRYDSLRERDQKASQSTALGIHLREQRTTLSEPRIIRQAIAETLTLLEEAELGYLDWNDTLRNLGDGSQEIEALVQLARERGPLTADESQELREQLRMAVEQKIAFLTQLLAAYAEYTRALTNYEQEQQEYLALVQEVTTFIDERILWIRSHRPVWSLDLLSDTESLAWIIHPATWQDVVAALHVDVWKVPAQYLAAIVVFLCLFFLAGWNKRHLHKLSSVAASRILGDIRPTLVAFVHTVLLSLTWPSLGLFVGYRLSIALEASSTVHRMGQGLFQVSLFLLGLELMRNIVRPNGLAEAHFRWPENSMGILRTQLRRLQRLGVPLMLAVAMLNARATDSTNDLLERLGFCSLMLLFAGSFHAILHPQGGVVSDWIEKHGGPWIRGLHGVWSMLAVGVPLLFAGLALSGYYYTALNLTYKFWLTLILVMTAVLVRATIYRWLMLRRRRLAVEQARERRAQAVAQSASETSIRAQLLDLIETPALDLASINEQSQRMIATTLFILTLVGIWFIWVDVLPALNYFQRWGFDIYEERVDQRETESGAIEYTTRLVVRKISLVSMFWAVLIIILMVTASRNLPGLLEIGLLERLPVDNSSRYAVTTIVRYVIILAGIVLAAQAVGIGWNKVQWLAAALTFGLGFGLQEIFANFVSGLIILFEQPVRVGDVVTIDGISGKVTRIRIRSTTVTDWDRKDYIVPNREFITGKLLNWTRSDTITRLVITVGISYSADADEAQRVLLKVAEDHPLIMKDPPPRVFMEGFGDSSLNMKLFVFLPNLDSRLDVLHQLNAGIHRALQAAKIEIPFPQRDLHLKTWTEGASPEKGFSAPASRSQN